MACKQTPPMFGKIKKFIDKYDWFYILGHERPDGDCLGSQIAMALLLKRLEKQTILLSAGPFSDIVSQMFQSHFFNVLHKAPTPPPKSKTALLCVDTSSPDRMGQAFEPIYSLPAAVIDHHTDGGTYGTVQYIDSSAPANTILIYRLFKEYNLVPTREEAYFIFLGILTDTQFFRFARADDPEPFLIASELIQLGVTPKEIYQQIDYGYTFLSRKVTAKILERAIRINNNRIIMTYLNHQDYIHLDDIPQSYEVYQILQGTQKTEMVVYIQEILDNNNKVCCKVGLRSKNKVDVGRIAKFFNGGGHAQAAGFTIHEPILKTWDILLKFFDEYNI